MSSPSQQLRVQALKTWAIALVLLGCAGFTQPLLKSALSLLGPKSAGQILKLIQPGLPYLPWVLAGLGLWLAWNGWQSWQRSGWSRRSHTKTSSGGGAIASILNPLSQQGWSLESGVTLAGAGALDYVARSPQGQVFAIQVHNQGGKIGLEESLTREGRSVTRLVRRYDQSSQALEVDVLGQARHQANSLQRHRNLSTPVLPLVVFPQAMLDIATNPVQGVYVLTPKSLRTTLLSLARPSASR